MDDKQLAEEYAEQGVDLSELSDQSKEEPKAEEAKEAPKEEEKSKDEEPQEEPKKIEKSDEEEPEDEPLQEPKEQRKRSIYDEYKDKKQELKSERELREEAERERDELKQKLEAVNTADTPAEKKEAQDDLDAFATEINADPTALKRMRELFLKDIKPSSDNEEIKQQLDEFKRWKEDNQQAIEKQAFEDEFKSVQPTLKELFPDVKSEELDEIKQELDTISHSKEWHDKPLDYIAFKHKEKLSALVSPKKRGLESNTKKDFPVKNNIDFDPNADVSKLTPAQQEEWMSQYQKLGKEEGLSEDSMGRKIIV